MGKNPLKFQGALLDPDHAQRFTYFWKKKHYIIYIRPWGPHNLVCPGPGALTDLNPALGLPKVSNMKIGTLAQSWFNVG